MPKTYNTFTNVSTGDVLTATNFNNVLTNVNNYRVPPSVKVTKNANQNVSGVTTVTWNTQDHDTDDMWTSGGTLTAQTAGMYLWSAYVRVTAATAPTSLFVNGPGGYRTSVPVSLDMRLTVSGIWVATAGQTAGVDVEPTGGTTLVIDGTVAASFVVMSWIGQVS
jgi:hypothetical protein